MSYTKEEWILNKNNMWKTNPFSITARKRGVHSTTIANIPTRMTIPPMEQQANAQLLAAAPDLLEILELIHANAGESAEWIRSRIAPVITKAIGESK